MAHCTAVVALEMRMVVYTYWMAARDNVSGALDPVLPDLAVLSVRTALVGQVDSMLVQLAVADIVVSYCRVVVPHSNSHNWYNEAH